MSDKNVKKKALGRGLSALISSPPVAIVNPAAAKPVSAGLPAADKAPSASFQPSYQSSFQGNAAPAIELPPRSQSSEPRPAFLGNKPLPAMAPLRDTPSSAQPSFPPASLPDKAALDSAVSKSSDLPPVKQADAALGKGLELADQKSKLNPAPSAANRDSSAALPVSEIVGESVSESASPIDDQQQPKVRYLPLSLMKANPTQPRKLFSEQEVAELSASLKAVGVLQPILVRKRSEAHFEIVAGERRFRAAERAGLEEVPVIIMDLTDQEVLEIALIENVQRENLNPLEEAEAYGRLAAEFQLSQQEIATRVGKDRATVANFIRILKLPEDVRDLLRAGELSLGHAKALLTVKEPKVQSNLARKVIEEKLSVRALESIVAREVSLEPGKIKILPSGNKAGNSDNELTNIADPLRKALGTKVAVKPGKNGAGKVELHYFSGEELSRLVETICQ